MSQTRGHSYDRWQLRYCKSGASIFNTKGSTHISHSSGRTRRTSIILSFILFTLYLSSTSSMQGNHQTTVSCTVSQAFSPPPRPRRPPNYVTSSRREYHYTFSAVVAVSMAIRYFIIDFIALRRNGRQVEAQ